MALTIEIVTQDIVAATEWTTFSYTEQIGQPDTMSVEAIGFTTGDAIFTAPVQSLFADPDGYFYTIVKLGAVELFTGLVRNIVTKKDAPGQMRYSLRADGWEHLAAKRLVGRPAGFQFEIQQDGDTDRLPTAIAVDGFATQGPRVTDVQALWTGYWNSPWPLDLTTYVSEIAPVPGSVDQITFSGTDLDGAMNDLCAAGSAAAMWWLANDSPNFQNVVMPHGALHFGNVVLPEDGEEEDDLLVGLASADAPTALGGSPGSKPFGLAPYAISDTPDWIDSIFPVSMTFTIDHGQRVDAVYVRGATGWTEEVVAADGGGYTVGSEVVQGGTGFVGSPGGVWGEAYVDAPAAITGDQRDAFGSAALASRVGAWTGTIVVRSVNPLGGADYNGWHKGQAVQVTDADHGFDGRWFLIRGVTMVATDPTIEDNEYTLTVGDVLSPSIGYALRQQRLKEQRKEIAPATRFIPYVSDLLLEAGETEPLTMQLANDAGKAMVVEGVTAVWHLMLNGVDLADVEDTGAAFYLTDLVEVTDAKGQVTATLNAGASVTDADAVRPWAAMVPS